MSGLQVLIVDDEPLARRRLARQLRTIAWIAEVHEAGNVEDALAVIPQVTPDILLVDIQMPDGTGFDLVRRLNNPSMAVIFVTAFDDQALKAFDANAIDYVTKPIEPGRLRIALERARHAAMLSSSMDRISELEEVVAALRQRDFSAARGKPELWVRSQGDYVRILPSAITHAQAERDYVRIHADGHEYLYHENLGTLERMLPSEQFLRIHRSTIVRIDAVERVKAGSFSSLALLLANGVELRVGRTYTAGIRNQLMARQ